MIAATTSAASESPSCEARVHRQQARRARPPSPPCRRRSAARWSAAPGCRSGARRERDAHAARLPAPARRPSPRTRTSGRAAPRRCSTGADRLDADEHAAPEQDRRLAQRAEVLRAAVAVGVARGRPGGRRGSPRRTSAPPRPRRRWTRSRSRSARGCRSRGPTPSFSDDQQARRRERCQRRWRAG